MYLIFDTETTGLPKRWDAPITDTNNWPRCVQIAWQLHDDMGKIIETPDQKIKRLFKRRYTEQPSPQEKASWFSGIFFTWLNPILEIAEKVDFTQDMQYDLRRQDKPARLAEVMETHWKELYPAGKVEPGTKTSVSGLIKMIWRTFRGSFYYSFGIHLFLIFAEFLNAYLISVAISEMALVQYSQSDLFSDSHALKAAGLMLIFIAIRVGGGVLGINANFCLSMTGMNIRNGLNIMIFKKMTRRSLDRDTTFDIGDITNLSQIDANSFASTCLNLCFQFSIPFKIVFSLVGLILVMGKAAVFSFIIFGLSSGLNVYYASKYKVFRSGQMGVADKRARLISEVFKSVRFIKMMGLENFFLQQVEALRDKEIGWIKKQFIRNNFSSFFNLIGPALFMISTFAINIYLTGELKLSDAFLTAMVFSIFQSSFRVLGPSIILILDTLISGRRIAFFLLAEEIDFSFREQVPASSSDSTQPAIQIQNGNFYWVNMRVRQLYAAEKLRISGQKPPATQKFRGSTLTASTPSVLAEPLRDSFDGGDELDGSLLDNKLVLKDLNVQIERGTCVAVVGKIGSGKSSFLSAIMGELYWEKDSRVQLAGSLAYLSQQPWLTSSTIKEAILFGNELDEGRLAEAIRCANLEQDLKSFTDGINTMLGDRGVNLSGGQKTRLNLARCFYANRDIYLLDDPISALDIHVGKHVMEEGVVKLLKGKTRLVATHALAYLPYFDSVLVLDDGRVVAHGTYSEVLANEAFVRLQGELELEELSRQSSKEQTRDLNPKLPESVASALQLQKAVSENDLKAPIDKLISNIVSAEDKARGRVVNLKILSAYCRYLGGKRIFFLAFFCRIYLPSSNDLGSL